MFSVSTAVTAAATRSTTITIDPWGSDSFRVRFNMDGGRPYNGPGALEDNFSASNNGRPQSTGNTYTNGNLVLSIDPPTGKLTASRAGANALIFAELDLSFTAAAADGSAVANMTKLNVRSAGNATGYYGFGEHENGRLDQVGLRYDMEACIEYSVSRGGEVCLPWVMVADDLGEGKAFQFGLLWNVPAYGSVDFGSGDPSLHTWTGHNLDQADVFITTFEAGTAARSKQAAADLLSHYVDAVGHAPPLPSWASGYWHSKNRYSSQSEVEAALALFKQYNISMSVFVIDYFNWCIASGSDAVSEPLRGRRGGAGSRQMHPQGPQLGTIPPSAHGSPLAAGR